MKKLADYFGVSIDYLMTGKEETEKEPKLKPKDEKDIKEMCIRDRYLLVARDILCIIAIRRRY